MIPKEKREPLEITRTQINELTQRIRKTIDEYNSELRAPVMTYKCEEWRKSPLYHPVIHVLKGNRKVATVEINFDVKI